MSYLRQDSAAKSAHQTVIRTLFLRFNGRFGRLTQQSRLAFTLKTPDVKLDKIFRQFMLEDLGESKPFA